jgi:hypothetical protein
MTDNIITMTWPEAEHKKRRISWHSSATVDDYFTAGPERDRYAFDFEHVGRDWYQWDTCQDAHYYGVWVNPALLEMITYAEGDIYHVQCFDADNYRAELANLERFEAEMQGMELDQWRDVGRHGLDDHDGRHWAKVDAHQEAAA